VGDNIAPQHIKVTPTCLGPVNWELWKLIAPTGLQYIQWDDESGEWNVVNKYVIVLVL
jgi:hypothetical protein